MIPHQRSSFKKLTIADRITYALLLVSEKLIGILPGPLVWRMGTVLGALIYYLSKERRGIVRHNLGVVHPKASVGETEQLTKQAFRQSFANLLSAFKVGKFSNQQIKSHVCVKGADIIKQIPLSEGAILLIFHMGNWEALTKMQHFIDKPRSLGAMYRPLKNPLIDKHIKKIRESEGVHLFSRKEGLIKASKFIRDGGLLGILCDQWSGRAGLKTKLFGKESSVTTLPAILALKYKCPIIPVSLSTISPGKWQLCFHESIHLPQDWDKVAATEHLVTVMERLMRDYSRDIFWLHDRWKIIKQRKRSAQRRGKQKK